MFKSDFINIVFHFNDSINVNYEESVKHLFQGFLKNLNLHIVIEIICYS
jgi:hypothetical protein